MAWPIRKTILVFIVGAVGLMAGVSPGDAKSNLSQWFELMGLPPFENILTPTVDDWVFWSGISLSFILLVTPTKIWNIFRRKSPDIYFLKEPVEKRGEHGQVTASGKVGAGRATPTRKSNFLKWIWHKIGKKYSVNADGVNHHWNVPEPSVTLKRRPRFWEAPHRWVWQKIVQKKEPQRVAVKPGSVSAGEPTASVRVTVVSLPKPWRNPIKWFIWKKTGSTRHL